MKILWISQEVMESPRAVAITARVNMRTALERAGHEVDQVLGTKSTGPRRGDDGIEYWPSSTFGGKLAFNVRALRRILRTDADVVVLHQEFQVPVGVLASVVGHFRRIPPIVADIRTLPVHGADTLAQRMKWLRFRWSVRAASALLAGVTTVTPVMTHFLVSRRWLRPAKLLGEWSSGVALASGPGPLPADIATKFSALPRPVGVYLGVLGRNRGLPQLIQAAEQPDFCGSLVVIGSGPMETELKSLPGASLPHVLFTGRLPQEQAWAALRACDYGICLLPDLPWWQVSSPLKVLEYLANGLPMLASLSVHQALLGDYEGALLLEEIEPSAIAGATWTMAHIKADDEQRSEILRRYSWDTVAKDLVAALEKAR